MPGTDLPYHATSFPYERTQLWQLTGRYLPTLSAYDICLRYLPTISACAHATYVFTLWLRDVTDREPSMVTSRVCYH
eukprot:1964144-Rhodomonas_salina.1